MPGRRTFSTTARPSRSRARCTCAIDAEPEGSRSRSTNTSEGGRPSASLDDGQDLVERHGRDAAAQLRQFFGPLGRQQILARRQHLAELDEGGAELLERQAQALLRLEPGAACHLAPMKHGAGALEDRRDSEAAHEVAEPVPNEHQADLVQARQVAHCTERPLTHRRTYFVFFDSACWRSASAKPASSPLVSIVMFAPYSRTASIPGRPSAVRAAHAVGELAHHLRDADARVGTDPLRVQREVDEFAADVAGGGVGDMVGVGDVSRPAASAGRRRRSSGRCRRSPCHALRAPAGSRAPLAPNVCSAWSSPLHRRGERLARLRIVQRRLERRRRSSCARLP